MKFLFAQKKKSKVLNLKNLDFSVKISQRQVKKKKEAKSWKVSMMRSK